MAIRIVFMGTPDFAVPSLKVLLDHGYDVVGVITATDKYGGRGNKQLLESAVKKFAREQSLTILQPKNLKDPDFVTELKALGANLQVVVAFRMLPEVVWAYPEYGTFNLHGSLLPKYRGAAPINWAVINGEQETGVTTFFLQHAIDTGDILLQKSMPIDPDDTAGEVHDRMMMLGADTVLKTVQMIEKGEINTQKQNDSLASKAPKIFTETCEINFNQSTVQVYNFIRGLSPYPAAWTTLDGLKLKITKATPEHTATNEDPGAFSSDNKNWIKVATADGYIQLLELQLQGRKRMDVKSFLNGYNFS